MKMSVPQRNFFLPQKLGVLLSENRYEIYYPLLLLRSKF